MGRYFGTDGIRGKVNDKLTSQLAHDLGLAVGKMLNEINGQGSKTVVIGRDSRNSGTMLEHALSSGLMAQGYHVISLGQIPTPAIAYLTRYYKARLGVVISASHNPYWDNGIKFFDHEGKKLRDDLEHLSETYLEEDFTLETSVENIGQYTIETEGKEIYKTFLKDQYEHFGKKKKVILDMANGASSGLADALFRDLGLEVIAIGDSPDGININDHCGSTHLEALKEKVQNERADFGFAFDGDADRFLAIDEYGEVLDGDILLYIYAIYLKERHALANNTLVATVMSNLGLRKALEVADITFVETAVGDRFVSQGMQEHQANLGGEQSGHLIFSEYNTTGDGLLSAIMLLNVIFSSDKPLSELRKSLKLYPQVLVNVNVKNKDGWESNTAIKDEIKKQETSLGGEGRILVRASGTEPLIRVMIEGKDQEKIEVMAKELADFIGKVLG